MSILQQTARSIVVLTLMVLTARVAAQPSAAAPSSPPAAAEEAEFASAFELGLKAEQNNDYQRAKEHYERALAHAELSPVTSPRLRSLLALGWVHYKLNDPLRSVLYLQRAVADPALPKDRARDAQALIDLQMKQLGRLRIDVRPPPGARSTVTVQVDGREVLDASDVPVSVGRHEVRATAPGFAELVRAVDVAAGDEASLVATLSREPPSNAMRQAAWIVGGVAAASLAVGIGTGIYAWVKGDAAECPMNACTEANAQQMDSARVAGNIATATWIGAGVGAAASAILFWRSGADGNETRLSVTPTSVRLMQRW